LTDERYDQTSSRRTIKSLFNLRGSKTRKTHFNQKKPPGGRESLARLVVTSKTVDTSLDENQTELGILILAVLLKMLADSDSLLDEVIKILGDAGRKTVETKDAENLRASDGLHLTDTLAVTKHDADLAGSQTLTSELADALRNLTRGGLEPRGSSATVWSGRAAHTLTRTVHTTHLWM